MSTELSTINPHPRDERIRFVESSHTYFIDGSKEGYISTTTLVHNLFEKFDADKVIKKMMRSKKWESSPYFGMEPDQIKDSWEENRDSAAKAGTLMHENIENFYNKVSHETESKEFELFSNYLNDHKEYEPYRTEWCIFDERSKVCGSVDMVYKDPDNPGFHIIADWKRSKAIKKDNAWQSGSDRFTSHLPDCNFIHYSIQLGIYKYILQKYYDIKISETFIVVLHPSQDNYEKINTKDVDTEVESIMNRRKNGTYVKTVGLFDVSKIL